MTNWVDKEYFATKAPATRLSNQIKKQGVPSKVAKATEGYVVLVGYRKAMEWSRRDMKSRLAESHKKAYSGKLKGK
jgi:pyrrolidone-carboxylate peptidase